MKLILGARGKLVDEINPSSECALAETVYSDVVFFPLLAVSLSIYEYHDVSALGGSD